MRSSVWPAAAAGVAPMVVLPVGVGGAVLVTISSGVIAAEPPRV